MHFKLLAASAIASLMLFTPAVADAACCDKKQDHAMPCCADQQKACCADNHQNHGPTIVEQFLETDPQLNPAPPVRQIAEVWFTRPTMIGRVFVQGRHVIEHDNDRMARGEPCTHVYAYNDYSENKLDEPVATFHCTHLERDRANQNLVILVDDVASGMKKFTEFQFAGETASHGYPTVR